jgi:RecB family exonuclease
VFRQTLESHASGTALVLPALLTRDDWLARLHEALPGAPTRLTRFEREILMERGARAAATRGWFPRAPFELRPGLVSEMLALYDELRRRERTVRRFCGVLFDELRVERGTDRGSESLIHQTCFLTFAFLAYERGVAGSGSLDEHALRDRLLATDPPLPFNHLVVSVADHPADPRGLWPADFDLLGRLTGLAALDVVVTDETHDAGFRERLEQELPGIEEVGVEEAGLSSPADRRRPALVRPRGAETDAVCFVHRDREEELREVARRIRARAAATGYRLEAPTAIVFQRPLPYLYLARQVLAEARVPFQAFDALPLAGEPAAAALDLVLDVAQTGGTRETVVQLLRSPMLRIDAAGASVAIDEVSALDLVLAERRTSEGPASYPREVRAFFGGRATRSRTSADGAGRAAEAAAAVSIELAGFREAGASSRQIQTLADFLRRHASGLPADEATADRVRRGRAAVLAVLDALADACRRHDDRPRPPEALAGTVRHWIERHTFARRSDPAGVRLLDAVAARFGEFDHVHLVGLVEHDGPEPPSRSIFYTPGLLHSLGWPQEVDRRGAQQAAFRDTLALPARTISLHAFQREGEALVTLSPLLELAAGLPVADDPLVRPRLVFADELLTSEVTQDQDLDAEPRAWLRLRTTRPPLTTPAYSGMVGPQAPQAYRVSRVDRYVDCPFKYFAETVLGLPEEREESSGLSPLERGTLVHELFERFYRSWQELGHGAVTAATLPEALELFGRLARDTLAGLPAADRALEETRLLGSIVARGIAERVFELEVDRGGEIVDRLLEFVLEGPFDFPHAHGLAQRAIDIRGKADRIDVFRNGELRVIDYKLSRLPDLDTSVQLAVYAHAVQQALERRDGRPHPVTQALYLAFGDEKRSEGALAGAGRETSAVVAARASEFAGAIDRIEAGEFPARPRRPGDCLWCGYAGVCRKEYGPHAT